MDRPNPPSHEQLKVFGRLLRDRRNLAKLSRVELAQRAKISDSTIKFVEGARHPPSRATLLRLVAIPELGLRWVDLPGVGSEAAPALEKSEGNLFDARLNAAVIEMIRVLDEVRTSQPVIEITTRGSVHLCRLCGARSKILATEPGHATEPSFRHAPTCAAQLAQDFYARHPLIVKLAEQEQRRAAEQSRKSAEDLGE